MSANTDLGSKLTVTLRVELVETDLDDFRDHLERALWWHPRTLLGNLSHLPAVWGAEQPAPPLHNGETGYMRIISHPLGRTGIIYAILRQDVDVPSETRRGSWWVSVIRFRRDRLRLVVVEDKGGTSGRRLLQWLRSKWGDDSVREHTTAGSPEKQPSPIVETEDAFRTALYRIDAEISSQEWWTKVAELYTVYKRANRKFTYEKLAELLGYSSVKHVGEQIRKHRPETTPNDPK